MENRIRFQFSCTFILFVHNVVQTNGYLSPLGPSNPLRGKPSPPGSPWPLPQHWESTGKLVTAGLFEYFLNVANCEPLQWGVEKFDHEFLFGKHSVPAESIPVFRYVYITISTTENNQCHEFPQYSNRWDYESYDLTMEINNSPNVGYATINATTVWGALHGLETFSQLWFKQDSDSTDKYFYANVTRINDWPRFPHRGMMIDTARHYIGVPTLLLILDAMFHNKFNVFHWHITDDQSFPYVSTQFPELSKQGAYSSKAVYTPSMVNKILTAARLRGIRVIFEFDTPGHSHAIGRSHPELLTPCYGDGENPGTPKYPLHAAFENVDPTRETTYEFMRELFTEILNVTQDSFIHLGMDEVYYPCWNSSPEIKAFMKEKGYTRLQEVQGHYTKRHLSLISDLGRKSIIWQDPIDAGVKIESSEVVIQMWKDWGRGWAAFTQEVLDAGYQIIQSAPWYINYIKYGETWRTYYEIDPVLDLVHLKPGQEDQILGGEVCMWTEFADETNLLSTVFPFSSAVAERLWSAANSSSTDDAMWRLDEHRCRLLWRGIPAQPIMNGHCGAWEIDTVYR